MRSTDEQLNEIIKRSKIVREKSNIQKHLRISAVATCLCVALMVTLSFYLPEISGVYSEPTMQRYGSLLLAAPYIGYVMVGVLAFALGICVTLFCVYLKKLKSKEQTDR